MVSVRNLQKFFDDHPELAESKELALAKARELATESGIVMGGAVSEILGSQLLAQRFFREFDRSPEHLGMCMEDMRNAPELHPA